MFCVPIALANDDAKKRLYKSCHISDWKMKVWICCWALFFCSFPSQLAIFRDENIYWQLRWRLTGGWVKMECNFFKCEGLRGKKIWMKMECLNDAKCSCDLLMAFYVVIHVRETCVNDYVRYKFKFHLLFFSTCHHFSILNF